MHCWVELKSSWAQCDGEVSAYYGHERNQQNYKQALIFSGYVEILKFLPTVSQAYNTTNQKAGYAPASLA